MLADWVESIQAQCQQNDVAFFFKQWGGVRKDLTGRELNGAIFNEMPRAATKVYLPLSTVQQ
jgi:protein gp37